MAKEKIALLEPYKQTEKEGKRDKLLGDMPWLLEIIVDIGYN